MELRDELLKTYKPTMLDLLKLPGMGPKTVALVWESLGIADVDALEKAAKAGKLTTLPRFGEKQVAKLLKGIEDYRKNASRFRIDDATEAAEKIAELILKFPGIKSVTPAGSLRRGRETVGDLDLLVTGPACEPEVVSAAVEHVAQLPMIAQLIAKGQNKVAFNLRNGMQVDVRLLPKSSYGAALQYFTGSKMHGIAVRQRALKLGYTLSEYALASMEDDSIIAAETEEGIYKALGMDWIPPELRENNGEIELALAHKLPKLITETDLRGDVHMHTTESDGTQTIREMAEAAAEARVQVHRDHGPLEEPGDDEWHGRQAGDRACEADPRRWIKRWTGRYASSLASKSIFSLKVRWIWRTRRWRSWMW